MAISRETVTIGVLAILFAVGGAYGVRAYLQGSTAQMPVTEMLSIPVATSNLPADRVITRGDLAMLSMSRETLKERSSDARGLVLNEARNIIGRRLLTPVKQGSPILTTDLYLAGTGPNFSERLKPGFRAVSLKVRDFQTGTVTAGCFVDILFRAAPRKGDDKTAAIPEVTVPLLKNIEVLDVADAGGANGGDVVTLAVPLAEVNALRVVEDRGEFSLAVRPSDELMMIASAASEKKTLEDVLGIEPPAPPAQPFRTAIYRRGKMAVNSFVSAPAAQTESGSFADASGARVQVNSFAPGGQMVPEAESGAAGSGGCKSCNKKVEDANLIPVPDAGLGSPSPTPAPPRPQSDAMSN